MSSRDRYASFPQPELQLQLAVQQPARRPAPQASLAALDASRYARWSDALRASASDEDAHAARAHDHWSCRDASQLNTIAMQRACGKRSH